MILLIDLKDNPQYKPFIRFLKDYFNEEDVIRCCLDYKYGRCVNYVTGSLDENRFSCIAVSRFAENDERTEKILNIIRLKSRCKVFSERELLKNIQNSQSDIIKMYSHYILEPGFMGRLNIFMDELKPIQKKYHDATEIWWRDSDKN